MRVSSINELNQYENKIRKIIVNVHKRADICIKQKGSHFEHLMLSNDTIQPMNCDTHQ